MKAVALLAVAVCATACSSGDTGATNGAGGATSASSVRASSSQVSSSGAGASAATGGASAGSGGSGGGAGGGPSGDTWTNYAQGFFATYCVACHDAADPTGRDFRSYAIVVQNAATARCGVAPTLQPRCGASPAPKQFPIGTGPHPSDAERSRIVAWIDAGTPQ